MVLKFSKLFIKNTKNSRLSPSIIGLGIFSSIIGLNYLQKSKNPIKLESKEILPVNNSGSLNYLTRISPELAYDTRSTKELLNNYLILNLCNFYPILNFINPTLDTLDKVGLSTPLYWLIKQTLFKQFCGGETNSDLKGLITKLNGSRIGCILNFTIETKLSNDTQFISKNFIDFIIGTYLKGIELASSEIGDQLIAIKVSGLISTKLLIKLSNNIEIIKNNFKDYCDSNKDELNPKLTKLQLDKLISNQYSNLNEVERKSLLNEFKSNQVDYIEFLKVINPFNMKYPNLFQLTQDDLQQVDSLMTGLHKLGSMSLKLKIPILIDAEQSIIQSGIDFIYYELAHYYNKNQLTFNKPIIFQTHQMYLKNSHIKLKLDELTSEKFGLNWGIKLVRGAYIGFETENANANGVENPIHNDIDSTHQSYNLALSNLLRRISETSKSNNHPEMNIIIASHNINSILLACRIMYDYQISNNDRRIRFGQLLGMQDPATYNLSQKGYNVLKCVAYGPTKEVIPFLLRRAQENSSALNGLNQDQLMLKSELLRRMKLIFTERLI